MSYGIFFRDFLVYPYYSTLVNYLIVRVTALSAVNIARHRLATWPTQALRIELIVGKFVS